MANRLFSDAWPLSLPPRNNRKHRLTDFADYDWWFDESFRLVEMPCGACRNPCVREREQVSPGFARYTYECAQCGWIAVEVFHA